MVFTWLKYLFPGKAQGNRAQNRKFTGQFTQEFWRDKLFSNWAALKTEFGYVATMNWHEATLKSISGKNVT